MLPIELEPRITTLAKPLIIESACPGWQPKYWGPPDLYPGKPPGYQEGGIRFGAVPVSIVEQATADVEAVRAGAAALHHHPRDPKTGMTASMTPNDSALKAEAYELVFKEVDAVTLEHTWRYTADGSLDYVMKIQELLELGKGNRYCQGALVMWPPAKSYPPNYEVSVQKGVRFMEENHVKPINKVRSAFNVREMKRVLIDTGIMTQKPFIVAHDMGHPFGWPMDIDPWMPIDLISSVMQTKERIPDCIVAVETGGRNWLPITLTAILAGVDLVRVGIEDCYYMYPHRDDIIQSNTETVKKMVDFAHMIGREVATPEQARGIMGIELTSK
jgi:uncharacterized protein (DUF849 family)